MGDSLTWRHVALLLLIRGFKGFDPANIDFEAPQMTKLLSLLKATFNELLWMFGMMLAQFCVLLAWLLEYITSAVSALQMKNLGDRPVK